MLPNNSFTRSSGTSSPWHRPRAGSPKDLILLFPWVTDLSECTLTETLNAKVSFGDANWYFSPLCSLLSLHLVREETLVSFLVSKEVCDRIESRSGLQETSLPGFCFQKSIPTDEIVLGVLEGGGRDILLLRETPKGRSQQASVGTGRERELGLHENGQLHPDPFKPHRRMAAWFPDLKNITFPQRQQKQWTQRDHLHLDNRCLNYQHKQVTNDFRQGRLLSLVALHKIPVPCPMGESPRKTKELNSS